MREPPTQTATPSASRRRWLRGAGIACGAGGAVLALDAAFPWLAPADLDIDSNTSFWARELDGARPTLDRDVDADIAVIGGGFTGLSAACYLRAALPGRQVLLLEARRCGNGASGRNGAMLLPTTADRFLRPSEDPALDRRLHDVTVANFATLQALCERTGVDAQFDLGGAATVFRSEAEARAFVPLAQRLRAAGIAVEAWDRERTATALGTKAYAGAAWLPQAGQLHPGRLVTAWRRAALQAGVDLFEDTPVRHIEEGAVHRLTTVGGRIVRAPVLVLATNGYSRQLGRLQRAALPVWDYLGITPPLSDVQLAELGWQSRAPYSDTITELYYLGLSRDGRVRIGGGPVDYGFNGARPDAATQALRHEALLAELWRLYPSLRGLRFEAAWSGLVDMSLDQSPAVGRMGSHGNVYYAIGYSGHGVNLSSVFGRVIADLVAGREERWRWLPYLDRLPPSLPNEPLRWLAVRAGLGIVRALGW
jgi:glycine/D-amino acid oxidase-like deaminating enzyme